MIMLRRVGANRQGRDFVVGDVHGHFAQLTRQLTECGFDAAVDRLFFLGDVVDRGPDSEAVLAMIDQRTYYSVLGNHEAMMIAGFEEPDQSLLHRMNGGEWFYELPVERQQRYVDEVRSWPWAIEIDTGRKRIGLVHANVPDSRWETVVEQLARIDGSWQSRAPLTEDRLDATAKQLLWDRALIMRIYRDTPRLDVHAQEKLQFKGSEEWIGQASREQLAPFQVSGIDAVYMGHTYVPAALQVGNCHFLDSYREEPGEQLSIVCISSP